jgi:large repetitive protein
VSFAAAGTCVIDANQAGNAQYAAAPQVQRSITVTRPGQQYSPPPSEGGGGGCAPNC